MFELLFEAVKRPVLYERTPELFWDDPHISSQMLEAHLNPDWDAASRKHAFIDASAAWIRSLLPESAALLDLGCGPGLYTKRFAEAGLRVTGMDYSRRSIEYARARDEKSEYLYQNYLTLDFTDAFDAATLIYCDYGALTPAEREILLARVRRALKPGGLFLFDVFTPAQYPDRTEASRVERRASGGFWSPEPYVCLFHRYIYEPNVCLDQHVVLTRENLRRYHIWDTFYTPEELSAEVLPAGFRVLDYFGDAAGAPYHGESPTLCALLQKTEEP